MELENNLDEIPSWTRRFCPSSFDSFDNLNWKKLALIGTGVLVATAVCISVIVAVSVGTSSSSKVNLGLSHYKEKMNLIKNEVNWVSYSSTNYSLTDAFSGGTGASGKAIYVCRALQQAKYARNKEVIPGTFDPTTAICEVPYDGKANKYSEFDLLVTKNPSRLVWVDESNGNLEKGAISGGETAYDEELYISQFQKYGYTVIGKIHLAHMKASGPVEGDEIYISFKLIKRENDKSTHS